MTSSDQVTINWYEEMFNSVSRNIYEYERKWFDQMRVLNFPRVHVFERETVVIDVHISLAYLIVSFE